MSEQVKEDILHDHSEDPVEAVEEVSESLTESFGVRVKAEDGQDFYVPVNPLLQTMAEKEVYAEEDLVEFYD
jgi:hypothetical protein